ncbi:hypothetical protein [Lysinibacillus sp. NPDC059133]|uniref:hypothetical protein n=1 Tax=Lysinibacillus sp. NPDC059133 TaxID=3346737 RepID=UPI0036CA8BD6
MIGPKLYFDRTTGEVILTIPEQNNVDAVETTKEQDFIMFGVLSVRNPEMVNFIQLPYGQYRSDFEIANSWKVDIKTGQLLFDYPIFDIPLSEQLQRLVSENEKLKEENKTLMLALAESAEAQQQDKIENQLAIAELAELIATKGDI